MRDLRDLRAAVVGTGFIGVVHVEALRRLGIEVVGVVGSTPDRARAKATEVPLAEPYESFEAMLADPAIRVVGVLRDQQAWTRLRSRVKEAADAAPRRTLAPDYGRRLS